MNMSPTFKELNDEQKADLAQRIGANIIAEIAKYPNLRGAPVQGLAVGISCTNISQDPEGAEPDFEEYLYLDRLQR